MDKTECQPCTIQHIDGQIETQQLKPKDSYYSHYSFTFKYGFSIPQSVKVNQEYLIYDLSDMISSVGGTLGMCIGFSFTGLMSAFIQFIQNYLRPFCGSLWRKRRISSVKTKKNEDKLSNVIHIGQKNNYWGMDQNWKLEMITSRLENVETNLETVAEKLEKLIKEHDALGNDH